MPNLTWFINPILRHTFGLVSMLNLFCDSLGLSGCRREGSFFLKSVKINWPPDCLGYSQGKLMTGLAEAPLMD